MSRAYVLIVLCWANLARADDEASPEVVALHGDEVDIAPVRDVRMGQGVAFGGSHVLGTITAVFGTQATVRLPLHERAYVGELVALEARDGGGIRIGPPRLGDLASLYLETGAYSGLDGSHVGARAGASGVQWISRLSAEYRFSIPLTVRATLSHAALSFVRPTNIAAVDASGGVSFDTQFAEVGLNAGAMTLNDATFPNGLMVFALTPLLRLGAIDGPSFVGTVQTLYLQDRPKFGGAFGAFSFPILPRFWLLLRAGGSRDGFAHTDLALRVLLRGNGDHGSVFVLGAFGWAFSYFEQTLQDVSGPGGTVGVEFRP